QPDAQSGKYRGDQAAIDLDRVLENQEPVLRQLQDGDEQSAAQPVDENVPDGSAHTGTRLGQGPHGRPMIAEKSPPDGRMLQSLRRAIVRASRSTQKKWPLAGPDFKRLRMVGNQERQFRIPFRQPERLG